MFSIKHNIPLAPFSTFHIGGNARELAEVRSPKDLIEVVSWAKKKNKHYKLFAGGSNVVFPDEGIDGLVIRIMGGSLQRKDRMIVADSGVLLADLVATTNNHGLQGMEKLVGILGTVGGAIVGNAGAYGATITDKLVWVEIWDSINVKRLSRDECRFSYRESIFKHSSILLLRIAFELPPSDSTSLQKSSEEILTLRLAKYKPGLRCPGSFFKNIPAESLSADQRVRIGKQNIVWGKVPAGYLLDQVGARGMRRGGICIADFHGNLFINEGGGIAKDVKKLATVLKKSVYDKFGVRLEEEIRYF